MSQEPIIIQSQRPPRAVPANDRYNQLHSVFQRFVARATNANQNGFEKMLYSFERLTELSYQNQTDLHFCKQYFFPQVSCYYTSLLQKGHKSNAGTNLLTSRMNF